MVRRRFLAILFSVLLALPLAPASRTIGSAPLDTGVMASPLSPGSQSISETWAITLPLTGIGRLTVRLSGGDFLHLAVAQDGCDLLVRLRDPASRTVQEVDTPENWEHPEEIYYVAAVSGDHELEVEHLGAGPRPAAIAVDLLALRPASLRDLRVAETLTATLQAEELRRQGRLEEARGIYLKVWRAWTRLGEPHPRADLALRLGRLHQLLGDPAEAVRWFDEASTLFEALAHPAHLAAARWERGRARLALHDYAGGEADLLQALEDLVQPSHQAVAWNDLGVIYHRWGDLFASNRAYGRALELWRKDGNRLEEARTRQNRSRLYLTLGMADAAADDLHFALHTFRALGRPVEEALALVGRGNVELLREDPAAALSDFETSLVLFEQTGEMRHRAVTLNQIAVALRAMGEGLESRRAYRKALTLLRQVGDHREEVRVLGNLAVVYLDEGNADSALPVLEQALRLLRREHSADPILEAALRVAIARAEWASGRHQAAVREARNALGVIEKVRTSTASFEARATFHAERQSYYDLAVVQLAQLGAQRNDVALQEEAFQISERARARSLLDRLQLPAAAPGAELNDLEGWLLRLAEAYLGLAGDTALSEAEARQLRALLLRLDERRSRHNRVDGQAAAPAQLSEIRRGLLGSDCLLLHYHLAEPASFAWVITDRTILQFELASRAKIEKAAKRAYGFLAEGSPMKQNAAGRALEELADLVLKPVAAALDRDVVFVSSQGSLQYVPLGVLPVQRRGEGTGGTEEQGPLLLTHAVGLVPSASVALALASRQPRAALAGALVIADPRFGTRDLPRLESSRLEAERVFGHLDDGRSRLAIGPEARVARLQDAETARRRWLHLATHGQHNPAFPALSRLAFAPAEGTTQPVDFLYGFEIEHLDLNAELVVLSACGSALGSSSRSEGLIGLPMAFFVAGARQVIASLWSVDDERTVALMDNFYRSLRRGMDPLRALRAAQEQGWHESRWPMPWATFVYQGPGPVPVGSSSSPPSSSLVSP